MEPPIEPPPGYYQEPPECPIPGHGFMEQREDGSFYCDNPLCEEESLKEEQAFDDLEDNE